MSVFIIRRLLQSLVVVLVMSLLVFVGVNIVGDPVDMLVNPEADQAEIDRVIRDFGLDKPLPEQYGRFLLNALQGDLGKSFIFGTPALKLIIQRMPATLELAFAAAGAASATAPDSATASAAMSLFSSVTVVSFGSAAIPAPR